MADYRIISSDSHIIEPPDLWTSRVEPKFRDRSPHIIRREDGSDYWVCDDHVLIGAAFAGAQTGMRFEAPESMTLTDRVENIRPGGYIPEEHVKDMDIDGIDVGLLFPTLGTTLYGLADSQLLDSLLMTYNDWLAEFCKPFPKRLKGLALLNIDDVGVGVKEMERCAKMGLAGALITVYPPEDRSYDSAEYEPIWATAQDLEMPLNLHIGTNRNVRNRSFSDLDAATRPFFTNVDHWVRMSLSCMIFASVFERYPKLQVGSIEMETSWAAHFLDRLDYTYVERPAREGQTWERFAGDMLPSDYFHRNVFLGFQEDALGIRLRDIIGVDNLLWGSDYPHQESTFPRSQQILEDILADCTEEEKAKIAGGNCARIYHLD